MAQANFPNLGEDEQDEVEEAVELTVAVLGAPGWLS